MVAFLIAYAMHFVILGLCIIGGLTIGRIINNTLALYRD